MAKSTKRNKVDGVETYDDLTAIKGIREARQQWFRDTMKVRTYQDLAALSVDQIESGLKAEKQFPSRNVIAAWIAQAKVLAETGDEQEQTANRQVAVELPRWQPFASFVIEFQMLEKEDGTCQQRTTVHHIETDKNHLWSGIEQQDSMRWMLAEAGIQVETADIKQSLEVELRSEVPTYTAPFNDKLQSVLVQAAQVSESPLPPPISPNVVVPVLESTANLPLEAELRPEMPTYTGPFSDKLQRVLAKAAQISGAPLLPSISPNVIVPAFERIANPPLPSGLSDKMQQILARASQISSKAH